MEVKRFSYNGYNYGLKRLALTGGQVSNLVTEALKIYVSGDMIDGYKFNPVDMEINFYAGLFYLTVDGYDKIEDNDKFEELFSRGVHKAIVDDVVNAKLAYELMWKSAKEISGSASLVLNEIKTLFNSLPSADEIDGITKNLSNEWNKVKNEHDELVGKKKGDKE